MIQSNRREFMKKGALAGASAWIGWKTTGFAGPPSENLRFACFGSAGRAWGNISSMAAVENATLVAVAEVDSARTKQVSEKFPSAKLYGDWRKLLDEMKNDFDVAIVATPDHMHAPISMSAMQLGKHVYCEKPLTRTIHECRQLQTFAAEQKLATQMGIQVGSSVGNKTAVQWLRDGVVGKVLSVHSMNPKSWGSSQALPEREDEIPATLNWDQWIGVGKMRPFIAREFHPSQWRKRIGFGTGTLGDMGCHIYHPWYQGLNQPDVLKVISLGEGPVDGDSWPLNSKVRYLMKGNDLTNGDFSFTWYDGNQTPSEEVATHVGGAEKVPRSGSVVIGTKATLSIPHGGGKPSLFVDGIAVEESELPDPAEASSHHGQFADFIRGKSSEKPVANWDYAGPMTEAVLLGTVAQRIPGVDLEWDTKRLQFSNSEEANQLVHDPYREGWSVKGI